MKDLIAGYRRFRDHIQGTKSELFGELSTQQSPETLFITCSDSRIVPAVLTQSEPGDLFVIRNAGNLVPGYGVAGGGEQAAIEFAVAVLGVKDIVVCGHSDCGAMKGLLAPDSLENLPSVAQWVQHARPARLAAQASCNGGTTRELLDRTIEINALQQLQNLRTHPSVAHALSQGALSLHAWIYDIGTGTVRTYDHREERFTDLSGKEVAEARNNSMA